MNPGVILKYYIDNIVYSSPGPISRTKTLEKIFSRGPKWRTTREMFATQKRTPKTVKKLLPPIKVCVDVAREVVEDRCFLTFTSSTKRKYKCIRLAEARTKHTIPILNPEKFKREVKNILDSFSVRSDRRRLTQEYNLNHEIMNSKLISIMKQNIKILVRYYLKNRGNISYTGFCRYLKQNYPKEDLPLQRNYEYTISRLNLK